MYYHRRSGQCFSNILNAMFWYGVPFPLTCGDNCELSSISSVRSFGTEDRPTDRPIPPREDIFEYIIFRGSDIKDLTVCEPPKPTCSYPQDPAIVQVHLHTPQTPRTVTLCFSVT